MASVYKRKGSRKFQIGYTDEFGDRRHITGTCSKQASAAIAKQLEAEVAAIRAGVLDRSVLRFKHSNKRPLAKHLEEYIAHLESKGGAKKHRNQTQKSIEAVLKACQWGAIADIDSAHVVEYLNEIAASCSARTVNYYRTAMCGFSRWLVATQRLRADPLACVPRRNEEADRRRVRRTLTDKEMAAFLMYAKTAPDEVEIEKKFRSKGKLQTCTQRIRIQHRYYLYMIACATGLRLSEIRSLKPNSFNLEGDEPSITVRAGYTKNRKTAVQPIGTAQVEQLREWLATLDPAEIIWPNLPHAMASVVRVDLKAAGIDAVDDQGRVFDFHAFRHQFVTWIENTDLSLRAKMELSRHSTPALLVRYSHTRMADKRAAVDGLPLASNSQQPSSL